MRDAKNASEEIIFVNPPAFIEGTLNTQPIPLGLIFMNRYLKERGYYSTIINLSKCSDCPSVFSCLNERKPPYIIGITSYTRQ